jgi:sulfur carrier protein ThiS
MSNLTLVVIPGPGARNVTLSDNMTIASLITQENLSGRDIIVNGQTVSRDAYATTLLSEGMEIFATASVKGNVNSATLVVIPGPGARNVTFTNDTTISDLIAQENLSGRDIILDGQTVPRDAYATTLVPVNSEIFATASVKGNVKNGPSTTGRPSGGGRGNNPPRSK